MATETTQISTQNFFSQTYKNQDTTLISTFNVNTSLISSSCIEFFIYDNNYNILNSTYQFTDYTIQNNGQSPGNNGDVSEILLDPENALISQGYTQGQYNSYFNFFNKQIGSNLEQLYISEISSDRTEIRLDSTALTILDVIEQTNKFIQERENSDYFLDFYLNFGDNNLCIANNIELDNQDPNNPTILVKLYESLPEGLDLNSLLWIVTLLEESLAYQVTFEDAPIIFNDTTPISGPNFNLDLKDRVNNSTISLSYTDLTTTLLTSSQNQLNSLLEEKEIDINIDYTDFSEFTHFSSVKTRLENFYYKVSLIEEYSSSIATLNNTTNSPTAVSNDLIVYENKINDIITNFDGYDYYLYYSSGSYSWPKTTTEPPYLLDTTGSAAVLTWFGSNDPSNPNYGGIILSASIYDEANKNNLYFSIPEYLREDPNNDQYVLFIDMMGQFYDNIWIYYKDVTQKYNADNRLEYGISKDIVADAIRDFGLKLYQNNFSNEDLYTAFLGLTPDGALFPFPNITGSLPTPSGYEYIDTLISASNDYMPLDDVNKSLYKRIYHNLPYLLKAKGTLPALRTLITSYGIPDTILRINEYGGKDKINVNDWDYWQDTFNYAFFSTGSNPIFSDWQLNPTWNSPNNVPSTLKFRFKTEGLPTTNIPFSQSLWNLNTYSSIVLQYTGSGYNSGSYSGSIIDPYYQYANLLFYPDPINYPASSASIYLPFFDGKWWSVMVTRNGNDFNLYSGDNIYEGGDNGTLLGFYSSSFINEDSTFWTLGTTSTFVDTNNFLPGGPYTAFSGSLQEIRYYNSVISESVFKDYIMNPNSIEGNFNNSSPNELIFRIPLGGELHTGSISIHPKITGSWIATSSFFLNSDLNFTSTPVFNPNTEYYFLDQPIAGIKNAMADKIRVENITIPSGDTLSPFRSLSQYSEISQSYTANTNLLEVAFSPQDEINEDISNQIGYFNIGEYIGDPRLRSSPAESYPLLNNLRNEYFEKYTKNYDLVDYIRLIKFFDNSLFKMIKDFVPARTSFASGIVIKQHLLERNKYPQPQVNNYSTIAYYPSGSLNNQPLTFQDITISGTVSPQWNNFQPGTIENFSGGTGGTFEMFNGVNTSPYGPNGTGPENTFNLTQSWYENPPTISGSVLILRNTQDEFYNGEFSGSVLIVTTQSLAQSYPLQNESFLYKQVYYYGTGSGEENIFENLFLNNVTSPQNGEILFMEKGNILLGNWSSIYSPKYLKISKIDCSGSNNSTALGQLDIILINTPIVGYPNNIWIQYDVTVLNEQPNYYLYQVGAVKYLNQPIAYIPSFYPNQVLNYFTSASKTISQVITTPLVGTYPIIDNYQTETGDIPNYFNLTTGLYTLGNTPNTPLLITASITNAGDASLGSGNAFIEVLRNGIRTQISSINSFTTTSPTTITISASYYSLQGDQLYLRATKNGIAPTTDYTITDVQLLVTQSRAVSSSNCELVIFEPYITEPNFYYSNFNPVMNNINENRLSTRYEEVSYNPAIQTPSNFAQIISGSAIKADVQDSNYTTKRHIIPRYEGCKSTNQQLNVWTPGDIGTYGKIPSVQNLKTMVAYCDSISGWPPERMNASAIHILYLIKSDGTVVIPNVSEDSLYNNKGTFESGERLIISPKTVSAGSPQQYRNIIRGGTRIEPILYTQYGHSPASWNVPINFEDIILTVSSSVGNYTGLYQTTGSAVQINSNTPTKVSFSSAIYGNTYLSNNGYIITTGPVGDGVNLYLDAEIKYVITQPLNTTIDYTIELFIYKNGSPLLDITGNPIFVFDTPSFNSLLNQGTIDITGVLLSNPSLVTSDVYTAHIKWIGNVAGGSFFVDSNSTFKIFQAPIATSPVTSSGVNSIWGYFDTTNYPNVITSSEVTLVNLYGDPNVKMVDITGSGFNSVTLPWSIKYGDEFRFEGREDFVYQVGKIFSPAESGSGRLSQTGSIEVHFNYNLPVSASSSALNLDHFLIRRYIDDASLVLMEGFKPINSSGPFIVRPEYVVPELNKSVDQFILDLTQKGLIP